MDDRPTLREARRPTSAGASHDASGQPGVIGIALAAVLTAALAQGSWQWFSSYIGLTLLAVVFSFYRLPTWTPGPGSAYMRNLTAFSLVVGLCVAITLAPALQRWAWLFPMPGTRRVCPETGRYAGLQTEAALAGLAGRDGAALAHVRDMRRSPTACRPPLRCGCRCTGSARPYWWLWGLGASTGPGRGGTRPWPPVRILPARTERMRARGFRSQVLRAEGTRGGAPARLTEQRTTHRATTVRGHAEGPRPIHRVEGRSAARWVWGLNPR